MANILALDDNLELCKLIRTALERDGHRVETRQAGFVWTQMFTDYYEWFGVAAVLLMLLYNGQRGSGHKQLFYWFYPAHVYLLYGASCLVYNVLR